MNNSTHQRPKIRVRDVAVLIFGLGPTITIGILGFVLGWWDKLAAAS